MSLSRIITDSMMNFSDPFSPEYVRYVMKYKGKKRDMYVYLVEGYARRSFIFSNNKCGATKYVKKGCKLVVT